MKQLSSKIQTCHLLTTFGQNCQVTTVAFICVSSAMLTIADCNFIDGSESGILDKVWGIVLAKIAIVQKPDQACALHHLIQATSVSSSRCEL